MKRLFQLLIISLFPVIVFSQTLEEKKVITKDYNLMKLGELAKTLKTKAELEKSIALELAKQNGWRIKYEEDGRFFELMKVNKEGTPIYYTTFNVNAAKSTRANTLHNSGILGLNVEGQNMTAHVWDAGLARSTHQEYDGIGGNNRFSIGDGTTSLHYHSAHVTGTIIASGVQSNAKGMAPQADAIGYEWNNDVSEATTAAAGGMLLSNHSYGWNILYVSDWEFGAYVSDSRAWDVVMYNAPYYLMVVAAGNEGNDNSSNGNPLDGNQYYDKLSSHSTSKNNLVVANAQDASINASNGNLISVSINSGSSEGPTDDYRIKPDIAGNGTYVYSTYESYDSEYASISGTSMASPNVCGTLLLLQQYYNSLNGNYMKAATLKGLALHTADDAGPTGPDAVWGWGLMNGKEAANTITTDGVESTISEISLSNGGSYSINVDSDGINDLIASISWTDPAGTANTGSANNTTPVLVNDLDIRVTKNSSTYYPYRLTSITTNGTGDNLVDPYEKVIVGGASGTYTITVTHKGSLSSGSQAFSLIVSGLSSLVPPVADFIANNTMPLNSFTTVNFTNLSTGSTPANYLWSFSPSTVSYISSSSTSQNPSVRFTNSGVYSVSLFVQNAAGNDTETKTAYIYVGQPGKWTGATSTNWNVGTNWENHLVADASTDVSILPIAIRWPTKTGNLIIGTDCNSVNMTGSSELSVNGNLILQPGKSLYVDPTSNAIIRVDGDVDYQGTFSPGLGKVILEGSNNSSISVNSSNNLTTLFASTIQTATSAYFDISATGGIDLPVNAFDINCASTANMSVEVWYRTNTYVGNTGSTSGWIKVGSTQNILGQGNDNSTHVTLPYSVTVPNGSVYGFFISCYTSSGFLALTGGNNTFSDSYMTIQCGEGATTQQPGNANSYAGYIWNGSVYYTYATGGTLSFWDMEVNKSNSVVSANCDLNIHNDFTLRSIARFTNATGNNFNVMGNTMFEADGSGMASFIDNGTSNFSISPTIQQYLTNNVWHFVGIPVVGALTDVYNDIYLRTFDEHTDSWSSYITSTGQGLDNSMKGYAAWAADNPVTVVFNDPLKNGPYSIPVTNQSSGSNTGWNLVGNPYPSSLDWDAAGWTKSGVDNTIYYYSGNTGMSNYYYYVGGGTVPYVAANNGTNEIPPHQGFFVHASANGTLGVNNNSRIHSGQAFYKESTEDNIPLIRINAEGNGLSDEAVVRFFEEANGEFDSDFDAYKLFADGYPQVYSTTSLGTQLAISTLPEITNDLVVPIAFLAPTDNTYTFTFTELVGFDLQGDLYLEDLLTNQIVEVDENTVYSFEYSTNDNTDRFLLHFSNPLGVDDNYESHQVSIYSYNNVVYISKPESFNGSISIYDILGKEIYGTKSQGEGLISIPVTNGLGYYLVKVESDKGFSTKKVFIK